MAATTSGHARASGKLTGEIAQLSARSGLPGRALAELRGAGDRGWLVVTGGLSAEDVQEPERSPFESFGALFLPEIDAFARSRAYRVVESDEWWRTPDHAFRGLIGAVCGRLPIKSAPRSRLLEHALRREIALVGLLLRRRYRGLPVRRIRRLPPSGRHGSFRNLVRSFLMGGALVELGPSVPVRVLDSVLWAIGLPSAEAVRLQVSGDGGAHGRVTLRGRPFFLRLAQLGGLRELGRNASALQALETAGVDLAPRLADEGFHGQTSWTIETVMPGRELRQLSPAIFAQAARFAATLPRSGGVAEAPFAAADSLATAFPHHASAIRELAAEVRVRTARLGSILEHGDMWAGNILVQDGTLSGVVDWDRWHPNGVPGTDVLQLYASTQRSKRRDVGQLLLERIWLDPSFTQLSRSYWVALGVEPGHDEREAIAVAWWLGRTAAALRLGWQPSHDRGWVERNIDAVLRADIWTAT